MVPFPVRFVGGGGKGQSYSGEKRRSGLLERESKEKTNKNCGKEINMKRYFCNKDVINLLINL